MKSFVTSISPDGNLVLAHTLEEMGLNCGDLISVDLGQFAIKNIEILSGYYCHKDEVILLARPSQKMQLTIRAGDFAKRYRAQINQEISFSLLEKGKAREKENAYSFPELTNPTDFCSIESFANFREIKFKGIKNRTLYRSASPFDNMFGRAEAVATCALKEKIRTVLDFADSAEELKHLYDEMPPSSRMLYESTRVIAIGNDTGFHSTEFHRQLINGFSRLADSEPPFLFHCRAGKRRSGFGIMLLTAMLGAAAEEITADYMISYRNNNAVTRESNAARYDYLVRDIVNKMFLEITGGESFLEQSILQHSATDFLLKNGMAVADIKTLAKLLSSHNTIM